MSGRREWFCELLTCRYEECTEIIAAYSRALVKYDLLSVTDGTIKRSDDTPVSPFLPSDADPHHRPLYEELSHRHPLAVRRVAYQRHGGSSVRHAGSRGAGVACCVISCPRTIVREAELKTVVCTPASALLLLRSIAADAASFATIENLIIVPLPPADHQNGAVTPELVAANARSLRLFSFDVLVEEGRSLPEVVLPAVSPDDMCMICYTSGTTGVPKGALLSHGNMVAVGTAVVQYIDTLGGLNNDDAHISYLPMAHVFEHFVQMAVVFYGARIGFSQGDTSKILDDLLHLRPAIFPSVPRLFNRITDGIFAKARAAGGVTATLFSHAFEAKVGSRASRHVETPAAGDEPSGPPSVRPPGVRQGACQVRLRPHQVHGHRLRTDRRRLSAGAARHLRLSGGAGPRTQRNGRRHLLLLLPRQRDGGSLRRHHLLRGGTRERGGEVSRSSSRCQTWAIWSPTRCTVAR